MMFTNNKQCYVDLINLFAYKTTAYLKMLVAGEGSPQNDLDSLMRHLLVGSPIMISILLGDIC